MNPRRIWRVMEKDISQGSRSFIFIFVVLTPFIYTLVFNLMFGGFMKEQPVLGIVDLDDSKIPEIAQNIDSWKVKEYRKRADLLRALESGAIDGGVVLEPDIDELIESGELVHLTLQLSGRSLASHRLIIQSSLLAVIEELSQETAPVDVNVTVVGKGRELSARDRFTPLIILVVIMVGGFSLTSMGIVEERELKTYTAISVTPTTLGDFLFAKALLGFIMSVFCTLITLILNGVATWHYISGVMPFVLLGGVFAVELGLLLGTLTRSTMELLAAIKGIGALLFAPALVMLFPSIPQWISKVFPTYYIIDPIIKLTMMGEPLASLIGEFLTLAGMVLACGVAVSIVIRSRVVEF